MQCVNCKEEFKDAHFPENCKSLTQCIYCKLYFNDIDFTSHDENTCINFIKCKYCDVAKLMSDLGEHLMECDGKCEWCDSKIHDCKFSPIQCGFCNYVCSKEIFDDHVSECNNNPDRLVECVNCYNKIKYNNMIEHLETCMRCFHCRIYLKLDEINALPYCDHCDVVKICITCRNSIYNKNHMTICDYEYNKKKWGYQYDLPKLLYGELRIGSKIMLKNHLNSEESIPAIVIADMNILGSGNSYVYIGLYTSTVYNNMYSASCYY